MINKVTHSAGDPVKAEVTAPDSSPDAVAAETAAANTGTAKTLATKTVTRATAGKKGTSERSALSLYLDPRNWHVVIGLFVLKWLHLLLPFQLKLRLFKALGRGVYKLAKKRRQVAEVNAKLCFPDMPAAQRDEFVCRNFQHWSVAFVETAMGWFGNAEAATDSLQVVGAEYFEAAWQQNKGVILLGAHFSTIDLGSTLFRHHFGQEIPVHAVFRRQKNPLFNHVMAKQRSRNATSVIPKSNMRQIVRLLKRKEVIWYAPDHDFGESNSVFVPFFGHPAATLVTTAKLASLNKSPVVMMSHFRNPDDKSYTLRFFPALTDFPSGDDEKDATAVNAVIESAILDAPDQYMWIHKRFKTQPGLPKNTLYAEYSSGK